VALLGASPDIVGLGWHPLQTWLLGVAWGVITLVIGFLYFWRAEDRYGRD